MTSWFCWLLYLFFLLVTVSFLFLAFAVLFLDYPSSARCCFSSLCTLMKAMVNILVCDHHLPLCETSDTFVLPCQSLPVVKLLSNCCQISVSPVTLLFHTFHTGAFFALLSQFSTPHILPPFLHFCSLTQMSPFLLASGTRIRNPFPLPKLHSSVSFLMIIRADLIMADIISTVKLEKMLFYYILIFSQAFFNFSPLS